MDTFVTLVAWYLVLECVFDIGARIFYPEFFEKRYRQGYTFTLMLSGVFTVACILLVLITFLRG